MHRTLRPTLWATLLFALAAVPIYAQLPITLLTRGYDGKPANGDSNNASVSRDGRYVAYQSSASNLVPGDTNFRPDVFVTDQWTGKTVCASIPSGLHAPIANDISINPSISPDGRLVAFTSSATNLVPGDTNNADDVFVRDLVSGTTRRVSIASDGTQALSENVTRPDSRFPSISADGRAVAFISAATNLCSVGDMNGCTDSFCHRLDTRLTSCESVTPTGISGNSYSGLGGVDVSSDGRYVVYASLASNLVRSDTNGLTDVFLRDRQEGKTELVSASPSGGPGNSYSGIYASPKISANGRFVLFDSFATNLAPGGLPNKQNLFLRDRVTRSTECLTPSIYGYLQIASGYAMDETGRFVVYAAVPSEGAYTLVLWDRVTKKTRELASRGSFSPPLYLSQSDSVEISGDGRHVAFTAFTLSSTSDVIAHVRSIYLIGPPEPGVITQTNEAGYGSIAAYDGTVFTGSGQGRLYAHCVGKGTTVPGFPVNVSDLVGTPVSLLGRPAVYGYDGPTGESALYLTTDRGHVVKMGLDGKLHWKAQPDPTATRCSSTPAVTSNGQVFVGLNGALGPRVFRMDARTGSVVAASVWLGKATGDITSLAVVGDRVYGGVTDGTYGSLVMLDATSLFPLARSIAPGEGVTAPPYVLGQYAWAGTLTGNLYKMSVNTFNPDPLFDKPNGAGRVELNQPIPGGIFPGTDKLYVGTRQGKVFAIDPVTGTGKSTPFYETGTTEPINGVLVDKASNTLHFGCGNTFYSVPLNNPAAVRKEPVAGKLLSSPVLDPWTKMVIVATDTGNLYRFNP